MSEAKSDSSISETLVKAPATADMSLGDDSADLTPSSGSPLPPGGECRQSSNQVYDPLSLPVQYLVVPSLVATPEARASLKILVGQIAHHVNNGLTVMMGNASMLKSDVEEGSLEWECASAILHPAGKIRDMVDGLLSFASESVGSRVEFDLAYVAEAWYDSLMLRGSQFEGLIRRCPQYRGVQFMMSRGEGSTAISANPSSIERVIESLVSNALDADPSGRVTLGVAPVEVDERFPLAGKPGVDYGRYVCLFVEDHGHGMDAKALFHACDPGFTTKGPSRMGLGLSAAYGLVHQLNGFLTISSEQGVGTRVAAYIPHAKPTQSVPSPTPHPSLNAETVLVVDDDADLLTLMELYMQRTPYTVLMAPNGYKAVETAKGYAGNIDLLVTDVKMPGMSGPDLADALQRDRPDIRVLYMSGFIDDCLRSRVGQNGSFLPKPFTCDEMLDKVKKVLG